MEKTYYKLPIGVLEIICKNGFLISLNPKTSTRKVKRIDLKEWYEE